MSSTDRFQKAWADYQKRLSASTAFLSLTSYCKSNHLSYSHMAKWLSLSGINVSELRIRFAEQQRLLERCERQDESTSPPPSFISFSATGCPDISLDNTIEQKPLKGVTITFPDQVCIRIEEVYRLSLSELLQQYNPKIKEVLPCSR